MNCGTCGHACSGLCSGGTCQCTPPSATNLLSNGGFNSSDLSSWFAWPNVEKSYSTIDSMGCADSGSLYITYHGQDNGTLPADSPCVPVSPNITYNVGGWVYLPSGHAPVGGRLTFDYYLETTCNNLSSTPASNVTLPTSAGYDGWQYLHAEGVRPPADAKGALLSAWVWRDAGSGGTQLPAAYFDSLYVTPAPGRF
jgi:hypothetical protein